MNVDDPVILDLLSQAMVARIATLSRSGRPSINPLYFIYLGGKIWLGTASWTLAARNVKADPRANVLFNVEKNPHDHRTLRISGRASVRGEREILDSYNLLVVRKYILTPGGIRNWLTHPRQLWLRRYYTAQGRQKGPACVIEVIPEQVELLVSDGRPS